MVHIMHHLWLSGEGTRHKGDITSVFMAPLPTISLAFLKVSTHHGYLILHLHLDFHLLLEIYFCWSQALVSIDFTSPLVPAHNMFFIVPLCCVYAMPRERGKPKYRPTYYNFVIQHRRTCPPLTPSLPLNQFTNGSVDPPHSDQNWHDDAQLPLENLETMPQIINPMINSSGCPVEEEIPPNWMEDVNEPTKPTVNAFLLVHHDTSIGDCVIEEEIPPQWWDVSIKGTTPNVNGSLDEATRTDLDDRLTKEENHLDFLKEDPVHPALVGHDPRSEQAMPSPRRFSEDHLQLIFEMRREMADQLQSQCALSRHLDMLFDCLSNNPAKSRFPTCCRSFSFTFRHDGCSSSPKVYLFYVMFSGVHRMHLHLNYVLARLRF